MPQSLLFYIWCHISKIITNPPIVKAKQTRLIPPLDNRLLKLQLLIQSIFIISANFIFSTFGLGQRFSNFSVSNINPYILHALLRMPLSVQLLNGTSSLDPGNSVYSLRLCSNLQNVYYYSTKEKKNWQTIGTCGAF